MSTVRAHLITSEEEKIIIILFYIDLKPFWKVCHLSCYFRSRVTILLLFQEAHRKRGTKSHLNFMQSGLAFKTLHMLSNCGGVVSCQKKKERRKYRREKQNTHCWHDSQTSCRHLHRHQNLITYACITIHIRYANSVASILRETHDDIYIILFIIKKHLSRHSPVTQNARTQKTGVSLN